MPASPKVQEPSMEEILASIRRIMADDEPPVAPRRVAGERPPAAGRPEAPTAARLPEHDPRTAPPRRPDPMPPGEARALRARPADEAGYGARAPAPPPRAAAEAPAHATRPQSAVRHPDEMSDAYASAPNGRPARSVASPQGGYGSDESVRRPAAEPEPRDFDEAPVRPARPAASVERDGALRELYAVARRESPADDGAEAQLSSRRAPAGDPDAAERRAPRPAPQAAAREDGARRRDLLSPGVDAAVAASFQSLGEVVLPHKDRTVEDLVKEILRPMLKDWLDRNLPAIVERLVKAEIERVARQPR